MRIELWSWFPYQEQPMESHYWFTFVPPKELTALSGWASLPFAPRGTTWNKRESGLNIFTLLATLSLFLSLKIFSFICRGWNDYLNTYLVICELNDRWDGLEKRLIDWYSRSCINWEVSQVLELYYFRCKVGILKYGTWQLLLNQLRGFLYNFNELNVLVFITA